MSNVNQREKRNGIKFDDDDGHYNVLENTTFAGKCKPFQGLLYLTPLTRLKIPSSNYWAKEHSAKWLRLTTTKLRRSVLSRSFEQSQSTGMRPELS